MSIWGKSGGDRAMVRFTVQHNSADHQPEIASQVSKESLPITAMVDNEMSKQ